jgi:hypothetical protein
MRIGVYPHTQIGVSFVRGRVVIRIMIRSRMRELGFLGNLMAHCRNTYEEAALRLYDYQDTRVNLVWGGIG